MSKKKRKKSFKFKIRIFMAFVVFGTVISLLGYNCFTNIMQIQKLKSKKDNLEEELVLLKEEKEVLETDILRLEDSDYIAKYVREKYFYSKDGELILRLD